MNRENYRAVVLTLTTHLPYFFGWFVGDAEWAMGMVRSVHGHEWGQFLRRSGGLPVSLMDIGRIFVRHCSLRTSFGEPPRPLRSRRCNPMHWRVPAERYGQ